MDINKDTVTALLKTCFNCHQRAVLSTFYKHKNEPMFVSSCDTCKPYFTDIQCFMCLKQIIVPVWCNTLYDDASGGTRFSTCSLACTKLMAKKLRREFGQQGEKVEVLCNTCHVSKPSMQRCARCNTIYYCSKECQRQDWKEHKQECVPM